MVANLLFLTLFASFFTSTTGVECYSGLKLIAGQSVGTSTISCNDNSQCYNMSANAGGVLDVVKAGCSLWRCMLARDRCISTTFKSVPISLCCCSGDRCNVGDNGISMKQVGGWNAQPEHGGSSGEAPLTREEIRDRFASADADDDMPTQSPRGWRHGK